MAQQLQVITPAMQPKMQQIRLRDGAEEYVIFLPESEVGRLTSDSSLAAAYIRSLRSAKFPQAASPASASTDKIPPQTDRQNAAESDEDTKEQDKMFWSNSLTRLLVQEYMKRAELFRNPKHKKKDLWRDVSTVFEQHGHQIPWQIIDKKWRNMKQTYKTISQNTSNRPRGRRTWEFYDMMKKVVTEDDAVMASLGETPRLAASPDSPPSLLDNILAARNEEGGDTPSTSDITGSQKKRKRDEQEAPTWFREFLRQLKMNDQGRIMLGKFDQQPSWIKDCMKQHKMIEEARILEMRRMHDEKMQLEKEKRNLLQQIADAVLIFSSGGKFTTLDHATQE